MVDAQSSLRRTLWVYAAVCLAVFVTTLAEGLPIVASYAHLIIAAIFLLTSIHLARRNVAHFGIALGGLLEPPSDDRPQGPLGLWDLGRSILRALPAAARELGIAVVVSAVVFPPYALAYYLWEQPEHGFALAMPPDASGFLLAQFVLVALPEEAFFRGYLQTSLSDVESRRVRILGVQLGPKAWLTQAALFAVVHLITDPSPYRLAVFFPGLLFGWMRAWRGGIGAPLAFHALSNVYSDILSRSWL